MATTGSSISLTGPLALYWRITMRVAAGAVAAAMAPSATHMGRSKPGTPSAHRLMRAASTSTTAPSASNAVITKGFVPMRLR